MQRAIQNPTDQNPADQNPTDQNPVDQNPADMTPEQLEGLAAELVQVVRSIRERVPDFTLPHATRPSLSGTAARVSVQAIEAGVAACNSHELLAKAIGVSDVLKDHQFTSTFTELRNDANAFADGLDYTIRAKRYRVGQTMRRLYRIVRRLAKSPENAGLRGHVEVMAKALARTRRKNAAPAPAPVPASGGSPGAAKE